MSTTEIERKFLLDAIPPQYLTITPLEIQQGYLHSDTTKEIRIRQSDNTYTLTIKAGSGLIRDEVELPITQEQFDTLWPLTQGRRLRKKRFIVPYNNVILELDLYTDHHAPLIVGEVEFSTKEESIAFTPPPFFKKEITGETYYTNSVLSQST